MKLSPTGLVALTLALLPNTIGYQDLGALLVRQTAVTERVREHLIASPFGTIHAAMFSMPRPVGTDIPRPPVYALANFDPSQITAAIGSQPLGDPAAPLRFPAVNRKSKRDSFISRGREPMPPLPELAAIEPAPGLALDLSRKETGNRLGLYLKDDLDALPPDVLSLRAKPDLSGEAEDKTADRVFFGVSPLAPERERIAPWAPGEAPVVVASGDPDIKQSALAPPKGDVDISEGESVAKKGVVTGEHQRPRSPADRLSLAGASRAKAEKCLATAIYFEARDEPIRAQMAVAQVVLNRVFSPYYPNDVCGVVYQNDHRHLACQFTFACDGKSKAIKEPEPWQRSMRIARASLDGELWMPDVAKSTHYHDDWARPYWIKEMKRMDKLGGLIFYRPRNWGDGAEQPSWGDAKLTAEGVKNL